MDFLKEKIRSVVNECLSGNGQRPPRSGAPAPSAACPSSSKQVEKPPSQPEESTSTATGQSSQPSPQQLKSTIVDVAEATSSKARNKRKAKDALLSSVQLVRQRMSERLGFDVVAMDPAVLDLSALRNLATYLQGLEGNANAAALKSTPA